MSVIAVIPYIIVKGAEAAIAFYKAAFGAEELFRMTDPTDARIGHAELRFGASTVMLADEYPDFGAVGPETIGGSPVTLHLATRDVDGDLTRAVQHGAMILRAPTDQSFGERNALLLDPFGHRWMLSQTIETVTPRGDAAPMERGDWRMTEDELALVAAEDAFNRAMVSNDVGEIRKCITADWMLVTPERGPLPGAIILGAIESGTLGHDSMTKRTHLVRVFGDVAFVTGRGQNSGWFRGAPIRADEWITDIYRRIDGRWICELTHLTPAAELDAAAR